MDDLLDIQQKYKIHSSNDGSDVEHTDMEFVN